MPKINMSVVLVVMLSLACTGCGKSARKHYEQAGGYSYDPPAGWEITAVPGLKYRISHGPSAKGFAPNINIVDENFSGNLTDYVDQNLKTMQNAFKGMKILKRDKLTTLDGQAAERLVIENDQQGKLLRQTFCFFENGSRKYVATCTALADGGEALDAAFEESMKTFRLH